MEILIEQFVGDELVIFNAETNACHSLSPQAIFIRNMLTDGHDPDEIAYAFAAKFPQQARHASELVQSVNQFLMEKRLVENVDGALGGPTLAQKMDRRRVLQIGGSVVALTVFAPKPISAASGASISCTCNDAYAAIGQGGTQANNKVCYACAATAGACPPGTIASSNCTGVGAICPTLTPFACVGGQVPAGGSCPTSFPTFPQSAC